MYILLQSSFEVYGRYDTCVCRKQLVVDDWCRYATIPSSLGHLLDREDSGICDPLRERECGEEPQRETEREKEDCYIIMQSCADNQEST